MPAQLLPEPLPDVLFDLAGDLPEEPALDAAGEVWTERRLLNRLRYRHAANVGNGPHWAYMEHVRDAAGFDARRTLDAVALHLWPSKRHEIHGYEVKVSRGDWRRELAQPEKAAAWLSWCDYFWIVAPADVVRPAELPQRWGLLVPSGDRELVRARQAVQLPGRPVSGGQLPRGLVAAMLRACARTAARPAGGAM